eukprot:scaffold888_cov246-Pinguiococcus_pyrenoidosus.AAC.5
MRSRSGSRSALLPRGQDLRLFGVLCVLLLILVGLVFERHDAYVGEREAATSTTVAVEHLKGKDLNIVRAVVPETLGTDAPGAEGHAAPEVSFEGVAGPDPEPVAQEPTPAPTPKDDLLCLCIVVRTMQEHTERLSHLVESLLISARQTPSICVHIMLLDVKQDNEAYENDMRKYASGLMARERLADPRGNSTVEVLEPPALSAADPGATLYADWARRYVQEHEQCDYIMHTAGTNYYISTFTLVLEPFLKMGQHMIAFDFVTHNREAWEMQSSTNVVSVKMRKGYLDIGAVVLKRELVQRSENGASEGLMAKTLAGRDFQYVKRLSRLVTPDEISMLHRTLLVLQ